MQYHRTFFTDFWRKVITFFIAIFVWGTVNLSLPEGKFDFFPLQTIRNIPVHLDYDEKEILLDNPNRTIDMECRCLFLFKLTPDDFTVQKQLILPEGLEVSNPKLQIEKSNIQCRRSFVKFLSWTPSVLSLDASKIVAKDLRVTLLKFANRTPSHITPVVKFTPETIRVRGPASVLNDLEIIPAGFIGIENHKQSYEEQCTLDIPDKVEVLTEEPVIAHIDFVQEAQISLHHLYQEHLLVIPSKSNLLFPEGFKLPSVNITIEGIISNEQLQKIRPVIDLSEVTQEGSATLPVQLLYLPNNVKSKVTPEEITVMLQPPEPPPVQTEKPQAETPTPEK